jgi:probable HAF family extracellular repeat protein
MASLLGNVGRVLTFLAMLGAGLLPAPGVLAQTPPAPAGYIIHELPTLGGDAGSVVEVNDAGMAGGWSELRPGDDTVHATLWAGGDPVDLGTLGGEFSAAMYITHDGVVAGFAETAEGHQHAAVWREGIITDLGTLGGEASWAYAVNRDGVVVETGQPGFIPADHVQLADAVPDPAA